MKRFFFIIVLAVLICFVVYTLTGTFGYLTFATNTCIQSDILRNYCSTDILVDVARGLLALVTVTSYPILTFCGRYSIIAYIHESLVGVPCILKVLELAL